VVLLTRKTHINITIPERLYEILLQLRPLYATSNHPEGEISALISDIIKEWAETELYTKKLEALARLRYNVVLARKIIEKQLEKETNKLT